MTLAPALVERVLSRLGFSSQPSPDFDGLSALYLAWCERVPFDNVRKRLALVSGQGTALPGIEPSDFFEGWLRYGTGATCWPAAGALHGLARQLGFDTERAVATMVTSSNSRPTHGSIVARVDGKAFLLDVAMLTRVPLPLTPGEELLTDHPAGKVTRSLLEDGRFVVVWRPLHGDHTLPCRLESIGASAEHYAEAYERSRAWSPFNFAISARLTRADDVIGLGMGRRGVLTHTGLTLSEPLTPDERTRVLVDELGIAEELAVKLPPDEPLPPPPV